MKRKNKTGKLLLELPTDFNINNEESNRILLHACCAPCSSAIIECMLYNNLRPTVLFYNPNIFPLQEYEIRKEELKRYLKELHLDYADIDYNHKEWLQNIKGLEKEPERGLRCQKCFDLRLLASAKWAEEHHFNILTTTLASSRWKDLEQINKAGALAEKTYPTVHFWTQNWRKGGLQERRNELLREYQFYNQRYCGCEFSLGQMQKKDQEKEHE